MPDASFAALARVSTCPEDTEALVRVIDQEAALAGANWATIVSACAAILGRSVAEADPSRATEVRAGIAALVDGYAMRAALGEAD